MMRHYAPFKALTLSRLCAELEEAGIEHGLVGYSDRYGQRVGGRMPRVAPYVYIDLADDVIDEYRDRALQVIADH